MSEKIRTTIYMLRTIHGKAHALMRHLDYSKNLTVFLEQLIREKWDACGGDSALSKFLEPLTQVKAPAPKAPAAKREAASPRGSHIAKTKGNRSRKKESEFGKG